MLTTMYWEKGCCHILGISASWQSSPHLLLTNGGFLKCWGMQNPPNQTSLMAYWWRSPSLLWGYQSCPCITGECIPPLGQRLSSHWVSLPSVPGSSPAFCWTSWISCGWLKWPRAALRFCSSLESSQPKRRRMESLTRTCAGTNTFAYNNHIPVECMHGFAMKSYFAGYNLSFTPQLAFLLLQAKERGAILVLIINFKRNSPPLVFHSSCLPLPRYWNTFFFFYLKVIPLAGC